MRGGGRSGASEDHTINAVVRTHFHAVTLHETTAAEEERFHLSEGRFAFSVEERVDVLGDVLRLRPRRSVVLRIPARNGDRRVARRSEEAHLSRSTEEQHFAALAIGHDGRIAIARIATAIGVHAVVLAEPLCHCVVRCVSEHIRRRPSGSVVGRTRNEEVDTSGTDVAGSRVARIGHGQYRAVFRRRDGRNAISHLCRIVVYEHILLRFGFRNLARHRHIEIRQKSRIVIAVQREFRSRRVVVVPLPLQVMSLIGRGKAFIFDFHRNMLTGNGTLCGEFKFADRITLTGRHDIVTGLHLAHVSQNTFARSLHIVGHGRKAQLRSRLFRCPSVFVGARTLRSKRTILVTDLHALHRKEHLQAAAVVFTAGPEGETRIAVVHLVAGLSHGIHVNGRLVGAEIGAFFKFPIYVVSRGVGHVAERHNRTAAGLPFHRFGCGEHLSNTGCLVVNAVAGCGCADKAPKVIVVEFSGRAHELDLTVVSGVGDVETIVSNLQRVPASAGGKLSAHDRRGLKRRSEHVVREGAGSAQPESQRKE